MGKHYTGTEKYGDTIAVNSNISDRGVGFVDLNMGHTTLCCLTKRDIEAIRDHTIQLLTNWPENKTINASNEIKG